MRKDLTNTAILWFILTIVAELFLPLLPFPIASAQEALASDESFRILLVLGAPVFTFVVAVLAYSLWNFRAKDGPVEDGTPVYDNPWISGTWLAITASLCLFVIVNPGLTGMAAFAGSQQSQLEVQVIGHQWQWEINYPVQGLSGAKELVLPVNQRVKFQITSADVLHAFWIPAFREKMDAVPGRLATMYVTPNQIGSFTDNYNLRIQCTEICGQSHAVMSMPVRIVSEADFKTWMDAQIAAQPSNPISRGQRLADSQGCAKCHSVDGTKIIGPTWKDLYESQVQLADGTTVKADEAYLRESILNPSAKVVKDYPDNTMPKTFGTVLSDSQLDDLISYIASLSPEGNHIDVSLVDYKLLFSHKAARAGDVTFSIKNDSATMMHEMIVIKTDLTPDQMPIDDAGNVDENKFTENQAEAVNGMLWKVGSLEDIPAGGGGDITLNLTPGHYIMFCNKPGHYKLGMWLEFTVVP